MKTKKVAGVDLSASSFAFVGDPDDTSTWKLPLHILGDAKKTINHIKDAIHRFSQTKGIPADQRDGIRLLILGAAIAHNIHFDRSVLMQKSETPAQVAEPTPPVQEKPLKRDKQTEEMIAKADRMASAFLKTLGLD